MIAPRWYCVSREGMATLCCDEADAQAEAQKQQDEYPRSGPYIAQRLVDAAEIDRLQETLKLQQASYEREIVLDVAAERERCIAVVMYELDSNGQAQAIEAEIRGVDWQNAKRKEAEDRLAKLRIQGTAAGNMWAALDGA